METTEIRKEKNITKDNAKAQFKYLLYNYHSNDFQIKSSVENRLFNFKSLNNLDNVQHELNEARQSCVKLPQISIVVYYDKDEKKRQKELKQKLAREDSEDYLYKKLSDETVA